MNPATSLRGARPLYLTKARALYLQYGQMYAVSDEPAERP